MSGNAPQPINTTSNPMPITTTGSWLCQDCLQQVTLPHVCPNIVEKVVAVVMENLSREHRHLNKRQQLGLNIWLADHTHGVVRRMEEISDWLKGLPIETIVWEGMTISAEIYWFMYKGDDFEQVNTLH